MILEKTIIEEEFKLQQSDVIESIEKYIKYLDAMELKIDPAKTKSGYVKSLIAQRNFINKVLGLIKISDDYIELIESNNVMLTSRLAYLQTANENQFRLLEKLAKFK